MKIQIITIITIISLISLVSAIDIFSGESYLFPSEQFEYFEVVGNTSSPEGMSVEWLDGNTIISFDKGFKSDSFTLIFFNEIEKIVEVQVGGGGGSTTKYVDRNITKIEIVEVPGEKEIVTETLPGDVIIENKIPTWIKILIGGLVLIVIIVLIVIQKNKKEVLVK